MIVTNNGYEKGSFCKRYVLSSGHEWKDLNKNKLRIIEVYFYTTNIYLVIIVAYGECNWRILLMTQRPLRETLLRRPDLVTEVETHRPSRETLLRKNRNGFGITQSPLRETLL